MAVNFSRAASRSLRTFGVHTHLFEGHVELEGFFEEVGWGYLFLLCSRCFGSVCRRAGLLFKLDAFEGEQVLGAGDGGAEGAVGVVELRAGGERGLLLRKGFAGEAVGVELAGLSVKGLLERGEVEVQVRREREEGEVVGGHLL
jgi:hypothetical protein